MAADTATAQSSRTGPLALGLAALSAALFGVVGLLGPSGAVAPIGGDRPPYDLGVDPPTGLTVAILITAYVVGTAALLLALRALAQGWRPDARRILAGVTMAVAVLCLVPPVGSPDPLSYAAYGRIAAQGGDPYIESPLDWRGGTDPVTSAVQPPWQRTPSVYGPIGTAEQALASVLGGDSPARTVWWLSVLGGIAFLATAALTVVLAGADPSRRARAAVLVGANPLLIGTGVVGAHIDVVGVAFVAAGLVALRRNPLLAGALIGAGVGVKLSLALFVLAAAWPLRHRVGDLVRLGAGTLLVLIPAYAWAGRHAFEQLGEASRFVSLATPWNIIADPVDDALGFGTSRRVIGLAAVALAAVLVLALSRLLPPADTDVAGQAAWAGTVLLGAWVLSAPYSLPWYDLAWWVPLAVIAPSRVDLAAVARTATLGVAYVPGLGGDQGPVAARMLTWRGSVTPWLELALVVTLVVAGRRAAGPRSRVPAPSPRQRAPAAPRSPTRPPG